MPKRKQQNGSFKEKSGDINLTKYCKVENIKGNPDTEIADEGDPQNYSRNQDKSLNGATSCRDAKEIAVASSLDNKEHIRSHIKVTCQKHEPDSTEKHKRNDISLVIFPSKERAEKDMYWSNNQCVPPKGRGPPPANRSVAQGRYGVPGYQVSMNQALQNIPRQQNNQSLSGYGYQQQNMVNNNIQQQWRGQHTWFTQSQRGNFTQQWQPRQSTWLQNQPFSAWTSRQPTSQHNHSWQLKTNTQQNNRVAPLVTYRQTSTLKSVPSSITSPIKTVAPNLRRGSLPEIQSRPTRWDSGQRTSNSKNLRVINVQILEPPSIDTSGMPQCEVKHTSLKDKQKSSVEEETVPNIEETVPENVKTEVLSQSCAVNVAVGVKTEILSQSGVENVDINVKTELIIQSGAAIENINVSETILNQDNAENENVGLNIKKEILSQGDSANEDINVKTQVLSQNCVTNRDKDIDLSETPALDSTMIQETSQQIPGLESTMDQHQTDDLSILAKDPLNISDSQSSVSSVTTTSSYKTLKDITGVVGEPVVLLKRLDMDKLKKNTISDIKKTEKDNNAVNNTKCLAAQLKVIPGGLGKLASRAANLAKQSPLLVAHMVTGNDDEELDEGLDENDQEEISKQDTVLDSDKRITALSEDLLLDLNPEDLVFSNSDDSDCEGLTALHNQSISSRNYQCLLNKIEDKSEVEGSTMDSNEDLPDASTENNKQTHMFSIDELLKEKKEQDELRQIEAKLEASMCGKEMSEKDDTDPNLLPEHRGQLNQLSDYEQNIREHAPGEQVFETSRCCLLFDRTLLPQQCGFEPGQGRFDTTLCKIQTDFLPEFFCSDVTPLCFETTHSPVALLTWALYLMSVHDESLLVNNLSRLLYEMLHRPIGKATRWVPNLRIMSTIFVNYGASLNELCPPHLLPFTLEELWPHVHLRDAALPGVREGSLNIENLQLVLTTFNYSFTTREERYSAGELVAIMVMLCKIGLDQALIQDQVKTELQMLLLSVINTFPEQIWPNQVVELCNLLPSLTTHHHNLLYLVQLLPPGVRGHYLQRRLAALILMAQMNQEKHTSSKPVPVAKLKVCIEKMQLTSEGDYYELSSFLGLLDLAVGNEPLPSSERNDLSELIVLVRHRMSSVRECVNKIDRSRVKFAIVEMVLSATSVRMAMFSFSPEHYDRLQEMVLKGSVRHIFKGVKQQMIRLVSKWHFLLQDMGIKQQSLFASTSRFQAEELPVEIITKTENVDRRGEGSPEHSDNEESQTQSSLSSTKNSGI